MIGKLTMILSAGLMCCSAIVSAQQKPYIVKRDTINLHGYIYDSSGKGVNFLHIESTQLETDHNTFKLATYTNERGYFELKGAKFNDTLTIGPDIHYDIPLYYNRGSRYVIIYLPASKVVSANSGAPFVISQKRKYPRVTPTFTVMPVENKTLTDMGMANAQYPGGLEQLETFIKQNIEYPESAVKTNLEGVVEIGFTVTKDGYHKDFKILRGISSDCDDQVLKALKKSANWQPALDHNQPVAMQETIAIEFKLTDN